MEHKPGDDRIVQLLTEHEEAMSRLYQAYAERFPEHRAFWTKLAEEEMQHADWLRRLLAKVRQGLGHIRPDRFDVAAVQSSLADVQKLIEQARKPELSLADALTAAMAMEKSSIEAEYFEVFEGRAAEVTQVQYCLADDIRDHYRRIEKLHSEIT